MAASRRYQGVHPPDCTCIYCVADRTAASQGGTSKLSPGNRVERGSGPKELLKQASRILSGEELQRTVQRVRQTRLARRRQLRLPRAIGVIFDNLVFLLAIALLIFIALPSDLRDVLVRLAD